MIVVIIDDDLRGIYPCSHELALKALIVDTQRNINEIVMKGFNFNGLMYDNMGCKINRKMYYYLCNMLGENPIANLRITFNTYLKKYDSINLSKVVKRIFNYNRSNKIGISNLQIKSLM